MYKAGTTEQNMEGGGGGLTTPEGGRNKGCRGVSSPRKF